MRPSTSKEALISQEEVQRLLFYCPASGIFTRLIHRGRMRVGSVAGWVECDGYRRIEIKGKSFLAHRLAWFYVTGGWPPLDIDHRNGNTDDNRWDNLREANDSLNMQNQRVAHKNNKAQVLGVSERDNWYRARITLDGKTKNLGNFKTKEGAASAYLTAKRTLHQGYVT